MHCSTPCPASHPCSVIPPASSLFVSCSGSASPQSPWPLSTNLNWPASSSDPVTLACPAAWEFFVVLVKHTWICVVGIRYDQCQCILYYAIQVMNSKNKRKKCPEFLIAFNSSGIQMVTCVYTSCFISFISFPACACTIANGRVQSYTTHAPSSPPTMAICQLAS
jgi:hypothetical protein